MSVIVHKHSKSTTEENKIKRQKQMESSTNKRFVWYGIGPTHLNQTRDRSYLIRTTNTGYQLPTDYYCDYLFDYNVFKELNLVHATDARSQPTHVNVVHCCPLQFNHNNVQFGG